MLSVIYACGCIVVPCALYQWILCKRQERNEGRTAHIVWVYIFLLYIYLVFSAAGIGCIWDICQLFNRRNTDIDDLMMNTLGTVLGYIIWKLLKKLFRNMGERSIAFSKSEPIVYLILAVLGEFMLFNWRITL